MDLVLKANHFDEWRSQARQLLAQEISPEKVRWGESHQMALFEDLVGSSKKVAPKFEVPAEFIEFSKFVSLHRSHERWNRLYAILWKIYRGKKNILNDDSDSDVARARVLRGQVHRDLHRLHSYVKFEKHQDNGREYFLAWYEPQHFILEHAAGIFAKRFSYSNWSLFTPDGAAHWDKKKLSFEKRKFNRSDFISLAQNHSKWSELWKNYYSKIQLGGQAHI